jgi:hypothetical protein
MKVRCTATGEYALELGVEYLVLAIEIDVRGTSAATQVALYVAKDYYHVSAPLTCFEITDPRISYSWRSGPMLKTWLIGYPIMLDERFQLGLENDEDEAASRYLQLRAIAEKDDFKPMEARKT